MADQIISNIVDEAIKEHQPKPEDTPKEVPKASGKDEKETLEDKPKDDEEWSAEDAKDAKQLFSALKKGGDGALFIIDTLAKRAGYSKAEVENVETKKEAAVVKDELMEALGEDYPDLAKKLKPAIDAYVDRKLKENTEDIRSTLESQRQEKLESRSEQQFEKLSKEYYDGKGVPKEIDAKMDALMRKYPPSADTEIEEYITDMFHLATGLSGKTPAKKAATTAVERVTKNNVPGKLDSQNGHPKPSESVPNSKLPSNKVKPMTIEESVRAAMATVAENYKGE